MITGTAAKIFLVIFYEGEPVGGMNAASEDACAHILRMAREDTARAALVHPDGHVGDDGVTRMLPLFTYTCSDTPPALSGGVTVAPDHAR